MGDTYLIVLFMENRETCHNFGMFFFYVLIDQSYPLIRTCFCGAIESEWYESIAIYNNIKLIFF